MLKFGILKIISLNGPEITLPLHFILKINLRKVTTGVLSGLRKFLKPSGKNLLQIYVLIFLIF